MSKGFADFSVSSAPFWFWWLLPVVATLLIVAVVAVSRRDRGPRHQGDAVEDYARFRAAMAQVRTSKPRSTQVVAEQDRERE